jgi:hypothetical protein
MAATTAPSGMFQSGVHVLVPAALNRPTHTLYSVCMRVQPTGQEWTVNRRYSQFLQLRKDVLAKLATRGVGCPSCASFHRALAHMAFPRKSLLRTNAVVRRRVSMLQDFLKLLVERVYNDLPKCNICGEQVKKMTRPFLMRGAQPLHGSILPKIQKSLSLDSYAVVPRSQLPLASPPSSEDEDEGTHPFAATAPIPSAARNNNEFYSSRGANAYQHKDDSDGGGFDPSSSQRALFSASCTSAFKSLKASASSASSIFSSSASSNPLAASKAPSNHSDASEASTQPNESEDYSDSDEAAYAKKYDDQRCNDPTIPLEDAMKQVVLPAGVASTYEDVVIRLTSMWAAYDMEETLASLPPERLSQRVSISAASSEEYSF